MSHPYVSVAKIGKAVGLKGAAKLHILSDFPDIIVPKRSFLCDGQPICIAHYDHQRSLVYFEGIHTKEEVSCLNGKILECSHEETRQWCALEEGYFFWFDIIGSQVFEQQELLGIIKDIDRIGNTDYLVIQTDEHLIIDGYAKTFLLPFIDRFIMNVEQHSNQYLIYVQDAKEILKAS